MTLLKIQEPEKEIIASDQPKKIVLGIDLGTTNSLVGVVENNVVRFFKDELGRELHKSMVAFDELGNLVAVGNSAVDEKNLVKISSIKRLMGKGFHDVKNSEFHFDESGFDDDSVRLIVGQKKYSPEEISAEILKYLKDLAEKNLALSSEKSENEHLQKWEAVITVPAYFDEAAKNATKLAAKLAGLEVLRLVNEPTAAALAYGLDNKSEGIYAVYDLGGGTFDVSILKMRQGVFKVLGVSGDAALGGDDFDEMLAEEILLRINHDKNPAEIFGSKIAESQQIKGLAREIKEKLSSQENTLIEFSDNKKINITRAKFETLIDKKITHTINLTIKLLQDLELESLDIKGVIMVGGSSRIPLIHQKLRAIFGAEKILTNLDPDRVVASGAAWQAFNLSGNNENLLLDVIPLSLGIEMMGGIVDKVILRNTPIPAAFHKEFTTYADNQNGMKFHIVQGEREFAKDCRSLANFEIKNIPAMKAGMARVLVSFKVDADGLLTINAQEKITGAMQEIIVKPSYGLNVDAVKTMLLDSMKNAADDMKNRLFAATISESKQNVAILKQDLEDYSHLVLQDERKNILQHLHELEKLLEKAESRDLIVAAERKLEEAAQEFVLKKLNQSLKALVKKRVDEY